MKSPLKSVLAEKIQKQIDRRFFHSVNLSWFKTVPISSSIQSDIETFQKQHKKRKIHNFNVEPLHSFKRKHICLDDDSLHALMKELKIDPKN